MFCSNPEEYLGSHESLAKLPNALSMQECLSQDAAAVSWSGYCPVSYFDSVREQAHSAQKDGKLAFNLGAPNLMVRYAGGVYALETEAQFLRMMEFPEKFVG